MLKNRIYLGRLAILFLLFFSCLLKASDSSRMIIDKMKIVEGNEFAWREGIDALKKREIELRELLECRCNEYEKYTLEIHVLNFLERLKENLKMIYLPTPDYVQNKEGFLFAVVLLHDIGKVIDHENQHAYTKILLRNYLQEWNFTEKEILLAETLICHDFLGEYIKGHVSFDDVILFLKESSELLEMDFTDFFRLQRGYYFSDASSYDWVRKNFMKFCETEKIWKTKSKRFRFLEEWILR